MLGRFDKNTFIIDIEVISLLGDGSLKNTIPVKIDTGFTDDLCLTYAVAMPLGLNLVGYQDYTIANGSTVTFFECLGIVKFDGRQVVASISVRPSGSLLIGVKLLKKLNCKMDIDFVNDTVDLQKVTPIPTTPPPAASPKPKKP